MKKGSMEIRDRIAGAKTALESGALESYELVKKSEQGNNSTSSSWGPAMRV